MQPLPGSDKHVLGVLLGRRLIAREAKAHRVDAADIGLIERPKSLRVALLGQADRLVHGAKGQEIIVEWDAGSHVRVYP